MIQGVHLVSFQSILDDTLRYTMYENTYHMSIIS
jgi:hypothetical protein